MKLEEMDIKILIVDTDQMVTMSISNILSESYETISTNLEEEIIPLARKHKPQIVLINYQLDKRYGIDFLVELKDLFPDIIGIIITTYKDLKQVLEGINADIVYYYIHKPINIETLKNTIHRAAIQYVAEVNQKNLLQTIKKQNLELNKQNQRLEELNRQKSAFIRNISHRFATPLTAILATSELLWSDKKISKECQKTSIHIIYKNAILLTQIMYNLSSFGKIGFADIHIFPQETSLEQLISAIYQVSYLFLQEKKLKFHVHHIHPDKSVLIDRDIFKLIHVNILNYLISLSRAKDTIEWKLHSQKQALESTFLLLNCFLSEEELISLEQKMVYSMESQQELSNIEIGLVVSYFILSQAGAMFDISTTPKGLEINIQIPL